MTEPGEDPIDGIRVGLVAVGRPTFDLDGGRRFAEAAIGVLRGLGVEVLGSPEPATDETELAAATAAWTQRDIDALVIVQATFSDSSLTMAAAETCEVPLVLWGAPEPRIGERLQHNAFCGINLAAYSLKRADRDYRWIHHSPTAAGADVAVRMALAAETAPHRVATPFEASPSPAATATAADLIDYLATTRIGIIGRHPDGFEPCGYDAAEVKSRFGASIDSIELTELFAAGRSTPSADLDRTLDEIESTVQLGPLGRDDVEPSARLLFGLRRLTAEHDWSAVATRCWPECFTEFGGAACSAQSILNEADGIPAMCEADAFGALTGLMLQRLTGTPAFVADIVDFDDTTAVLWHCGLAPASMAAGRPGGTTHFARGLPLVNDFALRPGRVTIARLSQSANELRLVVGRGEMLDVPAAFSGTAGTIRFDTPVDQVVHTIMAEGLEHHYGVAYGDVTAELLAFAAQLDLELVHL